VFVNVLFVVVERNFADMFGINDKAKRRANQKAPFFANFSAFALQKVFEADLKSDRNSFLSLQKPSFTR
jgi:hypothetical protein